MGNTNLIVEKKVEAQILFNAMRSLIVNMICYPDDLEMRYFLDGNQILIETRANLSDTGRIIGKQALTYRALSSLSRLLGWQLGLTVSFPKLSEPIKGEMEKLKFESNPQWPKQRIMDLIWRTANDCLTRKDCQMVEVHEETETKVTLLLPDGVPHHIAARIADAFPTLFNVIARANGRILKLTVETKQPNESEKLYA